MDPTKPKRNQKRADKTRDVDDRDILVTDANIWTRRGLTRGSILIENGEIKQVARRIESNSIQTLDARGLCALPGLIDAHVHLRGMKLSSKEDFATGTAAAAAGGFCTVLDMPNTVPATDSVARLLEKQRVAAKRIVVDVGFHAAARSDPHQIEALGKAGAFSLKLYLPKPIAPFDVDDDNKIRRMMNAARKVKIPVTVHAEDASVSASTDHPSNFEEMAESRAPTYETRAVDRIGRMQDATRCHVHYCHLTLPSSLQKIAAGSPRMTSEVTPHHLLLSTKMLRRLGWRGWMVPPLRSEETRRQLLATTSSGLASIVASDHAPHSLEEKKRPPGKSLPGIPGLETTLALMLTLVNRRILSLSLLVKLLAENPARIFGLHSKGWLRPGFAGDTVLIDLKKTSRINASRFYSKAKFSPFDGMHTRGAVNSTIVGGRVVYHEGEIVVPEGSGTVLRSHMSG